MQIFTMAKTQTGEGKDAKTEYQIAGNISLTEAQQMLTEIIIATAKNEAQKETQKSGGKK